MRQRVDVAQLAVLDAKEMRIRRSAAAISRAGAKRAEGHHGSNRFVHDEVPVRNIDAARYANLAGVFWNSLAGVHPAFGAVASVTLGLPVGFGLVVFGDDFWDGIGTH